MGWPGSGKTHLARRLEQLLGAPRHELDLVAYGSTVRPNDTRRTAEERHALLAPIVATEAWVTEGIYLWWINDLLEHADLVIWLDLPQRVSSRRILTRHMVASARRQNRYKGLRRLWKFWWAVRSYYRSDRPPPTDVVSDGSITRLHTLAELQQVRERLVVCRHPREVERLVRALSALPPAEQD